MSLILLDTNVLVYAYDAGEPDKQERAEQLLRELQPTRLAALSAQVLAEFFRVVTTRLQPPIHPADALELLSSLAQSFTTWSIDEIVVLEAARGVRDHQMLYWDAQVWATARMRGARFVVSEDFSDRRALEGITFANPFRPDFALRELIAGLA